MLILYTYSPAKKLYLHCKDFVKLGCYMKKLYNFRLDPNLIKAIDKLDGSRTAVVTSALQDYLQSDVNVNTNNEFSNGYDVKLVSLLESHIEDLKEDKRILQQRLDYFQLGWFKRILFSKRKLLPAKDAEFKVHG